MVTCSGCDMSLTLHSPQHITCADHLAVIANLVRRIQPSSRSFILQAPLAAASTQISPLPPSSPVVLATLDLLSDCTARDSVEDCTQSITLQGSRSDRNAATELPSTGSSRNSTPALHPSSGAVPPLQRGVGSLVDIFSHLFIAQEMFRTSELLALKTRFPDLVFSYFVVVSLGSQ
jgi:hypothetical protein